MSITRSILKRLEMTNYNLNNKFKLFGSAQKDVQELKRIIPFERYGKFSRYIEILIPYVVVDGNIQNIQYCNEIAKEIWKKFRIDTDVNYHRISRNYPEDNITILMSYPYSSWKTYYKLLIWLEKEKHLPYRIVTTSGTVIARGGVLK